MSRATYYAPFWIGTLIAGILAYAAVARDAAPQSGSRLITAILLCPLAGLVCQLVMLGAQGAFAQVMPVPGGRTMRGRAAVICGALLLAGIALGAIAALLFAERGEATAAPATVVAVIGGAALLGFLIGYLWNAPVAPRDFASGD